MTALSVTRNLFFGASLLALAACGQGSDAPEDTDGIAGFEPNAPVEAQDAEPVAPEATDPSEDEMDEPEAEQAAALEVTGIGDPALAFDPTDAGEQLFQRGLYEEALERWEADADAGSAYAAYRFGVQFYDAHHVERDIAMSARYQQLASELGSAPAMFELGSFHEGGLGVAHDMEAAANWYQQSANRGYAPAQHNIATMYEDGTGVPRDLVQAHLYYTLAIEQGFQANFAALGDGGEPVFVDPRVRLEQMMSEEEIAAAAEAREAFVLIE